MAALVFSQSLRGTVSQREHHRGSGSGIDAIFRLVLPESNGGERAFDLIRGADVIPPFCGEVEKRQQHVSIFGQTFHRRFLLRAECLLAQIKRFPSVFIR